MHPFLTVYYSNSEFDFLGDDATGISSDSSDIGELLGWIFF